MIGQQHLYHGVDSFSARTSRKDVDAALLLVANNRFKLMTLIRKLRALGCNEYPSKPSFKKSPFEVHTQ